MRSIAFCMLVLGIAPCIESPLAAQIPAQGRIVALDGGSANLLKSCCPKTAFESLIQLENEPYQVLNERAWSMRDASCLIYRGDQLSVISRLFRERLTAQGVRAIDLAAYAVERKPVPRQHQIADLGTLQVSENESFVMSLAIEQFRKVKNGF